MILLLKYWQYIAIAVLVVALGASVKAWRHEANAYSAYRAQVAAEQQMLKQQAAETRAANATFIQQKEIDYEHTTQAINDGWAAAVNRLRLNAHSREARESVRVTSQVCHNSAADSRLSDALQIFEQRVDAGMERYQEGIAGLLKQAQQCSASLSAVNSWAAGEQLIHH